MHVACTSNDRYLPHVATLMQSLAASNLPRAITLHLLHDDTVTPQMQGQLHEDATRLGIGLTLRQPDAALLQTLPPSGSHYPPLIWYRIFLPDLLVEVDRVLYLDADTLVLQDLRPLWSLDLDQVLLAAVAQPAEPSHSQPALARLGLPPDADYLNSGVLLMDLRRMREEHFSRQMIDTGQAQAEEWKDSAHFRLPDQDAFNLVCAGRWLKLHPRWNCLASLFLSNGLEDLAQGDALELGEAVASPAIVHFEGSGYAKPWNYRCVHPLRHLYRAYRRRTPWPLEQLEDADLAARVLRPLPPRVQLKIARLKQRARRKGH
ncbi:glycosyltransferase family 8 protein [Nocardioides immobilis]|uniref:Glycosyltransferase family 8 protein n=1 Tax=Nocardioides immobilis TaxID=2049295 RepID=A0A417XT47_9ACTN|nr:glycosyltransferase family 8 protein [Nocardioides immobilis]RHW23500.1 glycosyltransferase family 8 protein [Nocardioides immobilis]